jgi:hypothetical protein
MAAPTDVAIKGRHNLGDRWIVSAAITGGTTVTAAQLGLVRIDAAWFQDVDDNNSIDISVYAGASITFTEITAAKIQLLHVIGF